MQDLRHLYLIFRQSQGGEIKHETFSNYTRLFFLFRYTMSESSVYCPNYAPFFGFAGVFCAVSLFY
jgi:hypothetical protein